MGGQQNLFPDCKGFEQIFQCLLTVSQFSVDTAHIVVGVCQIRVGGRQYLFTYFQGFELVFQRLFMVSQVAVGRTEVVVCCRQLGRAGGILLPKLHRPVIAGQRPPRLH